MTVLRAGACALLLLAVGVQSTQVTPMEKVITLLKGLSAKVAADGAKDAAQYDKYACFCKEQADEKLYSIEKSDDTLASLKAQIKQLDADISALNGEVGKLSKKVTKLEGDIKTAVDKRKTEHDAYKVKAKDMNEAIDATGAAIDALKGSKGDMTDAKVDFAQVEKKAEKVLGAGAPKFEYQSNDIIATLEGLEKQFKKMKKDLDIEEFDINSAFDSKKLGYENEKSFAEKEKAEKESIIESKTEENEAAKNDRDEEQKDRDADQAFMDVLTADCEKKAGQFDTRSKTRSEELTTLADATAELQKGAVPNAGANKKLVGLQKSVVVKKAVISPVAFMQISNVNVKHEQSSRAIVMQKVIDTLRRTGSVALTNAAMRVKMSEDHFVKVRALIKDLIAKLKADALAESSSKKICDKGMKKAVTDRDSANAKIENANAKITSLTARKEELKDQIAQLAADVAELQKSLLEATELRNTDQAEHKKVIGMSKEAITSVKLALKLLSNFYSKAFVQTAKYTPPKADRSGKTVGDLAPEVMAGTDDRAQSESKGIIGILEVILSDFERTKKGTEGDERDSKKDFEEIEKDTKADIKKKQDSSKKKDGLLTTAEGDILAQEKALSDAKDLLESSLGVLEDLHEDCVAGEETWEERKKKREEEIDALKDALNILEDWQK